MTTFSMRRVLVASGLILGSTLLFAPNVKADPASSGGSIGGGVDPINDLTYTAPSVATLDPAAGNQAMSFGSIELQNNNYSGWVLSVASANSGNLKDSVSGALVRYTDLTGSSALIGASTPITFSSTSAVSSYDRGPDTLYNATTGMLTCGDSEGCSATYTANISAAAVDGKPAGAYSDTLTFTLTNKN